jgi:nucleotide-binding universal stress UspA family protein
MPGIVVGVDGSPNSERALGWAMQHAGALRASLTVLTVHEVPKSYWGHIPVVGPADELALQSQRGAATALVEQVATGLGEAAPASITIRAVSGFVVEEVVQASSEADMVVLGARGSGGFARLLVGSVSSQVVEHASCPVVIIPHER